MLYKVVLTFESVDEILKCEHSNESYWAVLSCGTIFYFFIMLSKVVLTFESVDEILKCDHSDKSYWAVLSCGAVYYAVQGGSNFWVCGWNPKVWPFKESYWAVLSCGAVYYAVQVKIINSRLAAILLLWFDLRAPCVTFDFLLLLSYRCRNYLWLSISKQSFDSFLKGICNSLL